MPFTKHEAALICTALRTAIRDEQEFILAHTIEWAKNRKKGHHYKIVPREFVPLVERTKRRIRAYDRLLLKLHDVR